MKCNFGGILELVCDRINRKRGKEMSEKVLIVVDVQNDFVTGTLGSEDAQAIVPKVVSEIREYLESGLKVYFTLDTHGDNYLETSEGKGLPIEHCLKGSKGHELIPEIKEILKDYQEEVDYISIEKPAFGSVELAKNLKADEAVLVGLCTDICVVSNALLLKANQPEMRIQVIADACAGVTPERHEAALCTMRSCQVEIIQYIPLGK